MADVTPLWQAHPIGAVDHDTAKMGSPMDDRMEGRIERTDGDDPTRDERGSRRSCKEDDCERSHYARGWCAMHYKRWLRTGGAAGQQPSSTCNVEGCDRPATSRGWCHGHYQRWRRSGDVDPSTPLGRRRQPLRCRIEGCDGSTHSHGLCRTHASRRMNMGDPKAEVPVGELPRATGPTGRARGWITEGYRYVPVAVEERHLTDGAAYTAEHRLVMARALGRPLEGDENVHHRNGNRRDNRLENLELWSTAQPSGQRDADKIAFAVQMLQRYAPHLLRGESPFPDITAEAPGRYDREPLRGCKSNYRSPEEIRTPVSALRGQRPRPARRRGHDAVVSLCSPEGRRSVAGAVLEVEPALSRGCDQLGGKDSNPQ